MFDFMKKCRFYKSFELVFFLTFFASVFCFAATSFIAKKLLLGCQGRISLIRSVFIYLLGLWVFFSFTNIFSTITIHILKDVSNVS